MEVLRFSRLHSLSPSLAPKYGSHLKAFVCREGGREGARGKEAGGGGQGRPDLFEQSGCNESSLGSSEEERRLNGEKSNCRQIVGLDNV